MTSRLAEFCTQSELVRLTGHAVDYWPRYIFKELVDNALDAAEEAGTAPVIKINASNGIITVDDNGPGIPAETVTSILDYGTRTSSRAAYVAPTRGAQGNALQTILAMPYVLAGGEDNALTIIESRGVKHSISFSQDPVSQEPCIEHTQEPSNVITAGTSISVAVPQALLGRDTGALVLLAWTYNWVNPHLDISIATSEDAHTWTAEDTTWRKWGSSDPTCPHWYDSARLKNLIAANVALARQRGEPCRTVADFISEFRGLSGTAKRRDICTNAGVSRMSLADLLGGDKGHIPALLRAMKWAATRPVKPRDLGLLGEDFLRDTFECYAIEAETFRYKKAEIEVDGVPYLAECAFAYRPDHVRVVFTGLNWSVTVAGGGPFHDLGDDENMGSLLEGQWAGPDEPVLFFLHLASPRLDFLDRGKSSVVLPDEVCQAVTGIIMDVTRPWAKQRRSEDRSVSAEARRMDRLAAGDKPMTIKDAAYNVMTEAYMTVSDNDTLPANARQIMYARGRAAARGHIRCHLSGVRMTIYRRLGPAPAFAERSKSMLSNVGAIVQFPR
jgi:DNA topoisomerase VI subunit B